MDELKQEENLKIKEQMGNKLKEGDDENSLIVDENNQVIDVAELINDSGNTAIAVRLKTLFENGISEEMITQQYMNISFGVVDKNIALENMRTVCDELIKYLSDIPNGIVINPITGEVDVNKSLESAVECGILRPDDVIVIDRDKDRFELIKEDSILKKISEKDVALENLIELEEEEIFLDYNERIRSITGIYGKYYNEKELEDDKNADDLLISENIETEEEQEIAKSKKEYYSFDTLKDMSLMQKIIFFSRKDHNIYPELLNKTLQPYKDSKFYSKIADENGNVDFEKLKEFSEEWIEEYNKSNLRDDLKRYTLFTTKETVTFEKLDEVNKANLKSILARGFLSKDKSNQGTFKLLCKNLGIEPDLDSILKVTGCATLEQLEEFPKNNDINEINYMKKISDMKRYRMMSQAEKMIFELTENLQLSKSDDTEAIARLYVEYTDRAKQSEEYSGEKKAYGEISKALEHYMLYNKEYFSEYMTFIKDGNYTIKNKVNYMNVRKILDSKEKVTAKSKKSMGKIASKIEKRLDDFRGEDNRISDQDFNGFFDERSEEIAISYENEKEERIDEQRKQKDSADNNVGNNSDDNSKNSLNEDNKTEISSENYLIKQTPFIAMLRTTREKIKEKFSKVKKALLKRNSNKNSLKDIKGQEEQGNNTEPVSGSFVKRVDIDHDKAIRDMQMQSNQNILGQGIDQVQDINR